MLSDKKTVLCISDSLGLPRDGVDYNDTWFAQLKSINKIKEFVAIFKRNETTNCLSIANYNEYLLWYKPEVVVLQLGICDCAPRYIKVASLLYKIVYRLPSSLQTIFWKYYKKTHKRSIKKADVPIERFTSNVDNYCNACREYGLKQLIIVKIATPSQKMVDSNPTIMDAITLYNNTLDAISTKYEFCVIVDPLSIANPNNYVEDGYHPNKNGNELIAKAINEVLID